MVVNQLRGRIEVSSSQTVEMIKLYGKRMPLFYRTVDKFFG